MRVVEGSLLPLQVNPLMQALLVFLAIPLVVGEGLLVETVPEPHYGEKFYQYGYQVEDLYTGEKNALEIGLSDLNYRSKTSALSFRGEKHPFGGRGLPHINIETFNDGI